MRILPGPRFEKDSIARFLSKQIHRKGFFRRRALESLTIYPIQWRLFRRVRWHCASNKLSTSQQRMSLIDEQGASIVKEFNERLLLWRPHYAELEPIDSSHQMPPLPGSSPIAEETLQGVINDFLDHRRAAQQLLMKITPELKRLQADPLTAIAAIFPRRIVRGKREDELADERKIAHSTLLATSLMTNCNIEDSIELGTLEDRVAVGTIKAEYQNIEMKTSRLVFLETAGVKSLHEALTAGRALTRLCQLNMQYRLIV